MAKKAKVEIENDEWRWEWEDDKIKKWVQYGKEVSDALCDAVTNNQAEVFDKCIFPYSYYKHLWLIQYDIHFM